MISGIAWRRRSFLGGLAALPLARPALAQLAKPSFTPPNGACDCHHHIYDTRWEYAPNAVLKPPPATVADYRAYQRQLGISRSIIVTPSSYAFNNEPTTDAIRQMGDRARGVAVVPVDAEMAELRRLQAAGIRGARLQTSTPGPLGLDAILPLARRIAPLGWHMQLNLNANEYPAAVDQLIAAQVPLIVDHMANIPGQAGIQHPAYAALRRLLDTGRGWVKISAPNSGSQSGPPAYADRSAIARALIAAAPERCLWGSNWSFPSDNPKPDPVLVLDILAQWAPDPALRHRILVENPEAAYGFDPARRPAPPPA
jgi:predicted TIM-barrel fold metal-dependent hydrolase